MYTPLILVAALLPCFAQAEPEHQFTNFKSRAPEVYEVNLDLAPRDRYREVVSAHADQIRAFLDYLHSNELYAFMFNVESHLEPLLPQLMDYEFFQECDGIADTLKRPVSEIIIFNYMYQLGAYHDFCTSISAVNNITGESLLGRNLDYGFQRYLANSSITLVYKNNDQEIFRTAGHAGMIGTHTAFKRGQYAVTLNQRIDGGLRKTLYQVLVGCKQVPFLLRKTMEKCDHAECAVQSLKNAELCAPVYFIVSSPTQHTVIERARDHVHNQYTLSDSVNPNFIVQTNSDRSVPDLDKRRTRAEERLSALSHIDEQGLFGVLEQYPNLNPLSLFTVVMNVQKGYFNTTIWY